MKTGLFFYLLSFLFLVHPMPTNAAAKAFVIGIKDYVNINSLDNPEIDATAIAGKLSDAGYSVELLKGNSTDKANLLNEWQQFVQSVDVGDDVVVYYSGHGMDVKGANYLVPRDAPSFSDMVGDVQKKNQLVSFHDLMDSLEEVGVGMQVWIIDACRTNPFVQGKPIAGPGGLTGDIDRPQRFILYSANYGQIALDKLNSDPKDRPVGSPFSRVLVRLFDTWKDRSLRDFAAELRSETVAKVAPFEQYPTWEDGLGPVWCFVKCREVDIERAIAESEKSIKALRSLSRLVAREKYPIYPNEVFYEIIYPMDQPELKVYVERVQKAIVAYLKDQREGRGYTSDDLSNEDSIFKLSSFEDAFSRHYSFEPIKEDGLASHLLWDATNFSFQRSDGQKVVLSCMSPGVSSLILKMTQQDEVQQNIYLWADFKSRVITKYVWCKNLVRTGDDTTSFSAVDLIGRTLTWTVGTPIRPFNWSLKSMQIRFNYDYGFGQRRGSPSERAKPGRLIEPNGQASVVISKEQVGLDGVDLGFPQ
ncbi:caspase family protein [Pseudomonas chlororaphis]|uniref:caspase family protein n=1 Tax=Pseudomonas chlororaphis TaxID=587753 RepID=UPI0023673BC1|nr:caspase family protein [Pseudomonas chlororaphis]WDH20646.1 caspase family protein [Pseudomonas chlororaphis]